MQPKLSTDAVVLIDTREQSPLFVRKRLGVGEQSVVNGVTFEGATLHDGDYTVRGLELMVAIERKMLSDFDAYMGKERNTKTIPKLERLACLKWAGLVVETTEDALYGKRKYGRMTGAHARGFLCKAEVQYGLDVYVSDDRAMLERWVIDRLMYAWKLWGDK